MMALGEATGAKFNYIPYGGGNPTFTAMLSGETDVGALPIANILALKEKFKVLGVFNKTNIFAAQTENAPAVNSVFGTSIPELSSSRSWAVHAEWANANPKQFEFLERTAKEAHASAAFRDQWKKRAIRSRRWCGATARPAMNTPRAWSSWRSATRSSSPRGASRNAGERAALSMAAP